MAIWFLSYLIIIYIASTLVGYSIHPSQSIVMLVMVKQSISLVWGLVGPVLLIALLMGAIKIYKLLRNR